MSPKQQKILNHFEEFETLDLDYAVHLIGDQYTNQRQYVGKILGNMVKRGMLERISDGVFKYVTNKVDRKKRAPSKCDKTIDMWGGA